jgi:hypothetical protein
MNKDLLLNLINDYGSELYKSGRSLNPVVNDDVSRSIYHLNNSEEIFKYIVRLIDNEHTE